MKPTFLVVAVLASALVACAADTSREAPVVDRGRSDVVVAGAYADITVSELQTMLASKNFPLVNVHVPFEGDLPATDFSIPFDEMEQHLDMLPADKDAPIVLYCRSGRMGATASETLARLGYTKVYNLLGGFNAWRDEGLPLAP